MARIERSTGELFERALAGNVASLGRLLTIIESGGPTARGLALLVASAPKGRSQTVGLTGAPGSGKSTLTSILAGALRPLSKRLAVLAIDPTSPFSGGAILGDRLRMQEHIQDRGVFIRSMATRGHLGGLSLAVPEAIRLLDAVGFDTVLVESVGVGQVELEISHLVDTTIVVVNPGWGDDVQAAKAGIMEIADIFVVNKSDRPGSQATIRDLMYMLDAGRERSAGWKTPIISTVATEGTGVSELVLAVREHFRYSESTNSLHERRAGRRVREIDGIVRARLEQEANEVLSRFAASTKAAGEDWLSDPQLTADDLLVAIGRSLRVKPDPSGFGAAQPRTDQ